MIKQMRHTHIYAYSTASKSAKALSKALGISRIRHKNSTLIPRPDRTIINWGCGQNLFPITLFVCRIINYPNKVDLCSDKLEFFKAATKAKLPTPAFTEDFEQASKWTQKGTVVGRQLLRGSGGQGIVLLNADASNLEEFATCKFWTKYIPKQDEFRIHFGFGKIFDTQKKMRKRDWPDEEVNWQIRNHTNGFIFARENFETPEEVKKAATDFVKAFPGIDFGALDLIYNARQNKAYILEVNTAPGLIGKTLDNYKKHFEEFLHAVPNM
jgi:glutathione synthase/RimK-type ligase-like ATP-grasp enzyme